MGNDKKSINEMEQIQRGLEEFLQQEMREMQMKEAEMREKKMQEMNVKKTADHRNVEPQFFDLNADADWEVESDFREETDDETEEYSDDYLEDWDSLDNKERRKPKKAKQKKVSKTRKPEREIEEEMPESRKKKKKSRLKHLLIIVLIIIILLAAGLYYLVGVAYDKMKYERIDSVATESMKDNGVVNVLLIGNDSRENGEDGRSDAMILLSISNKTGKIYMTSLLRDMYVDIPGHNGNRLNAAYSYGGAELLMETVEQNFDIEVNRYMLVNFEAFANMVDAVGGVELELTSEEVEYVNGYLVEYNILMDRPQGTDNMDTSVSGLVHLNGPQALAYSRNRYLGTDFGRTERQRKVLSAVIKKLPATVLTSPKQLLDGLMPNLTTNLTKNECFRLGLTAAKLLTYDVEQISVPAEGTYKNATIREMAVLEVDFDANIRYIKETIYGENQN